MGSVGSSNIYSELATLGRCDYMVDGFPYHHQRCEFEFRSWRVVLDTTLYDKVYLATGRWFSPCTPVSSTNKTDRHDIAEILLTVAFNTITITHKKF